jgi:hypothetical protein
LRPLCFLEFRLETLLREALGDDKAFIGAIGFLEAVLEEASFFSVLIPLIILSSKPSEEFIEEDTTFFFATRFEFEGVECFADNFISLPFKEDNCGEAPEVLEVDFDEVLTLEVFSTFLRVDFDTASTGPYVDFDEILTLEVGFDVFSTFLGVDFDTSLSVDDEIS